MCNTSKSVTAHLSLWAKPPFLLFILIFCVKSKLNLFWALIFLHCLIFNTQNIPVNQVYFHPYYFLTFMEDTQRYKILPHDSWPCHPSGWAQIPCPLLCKEQAAQGLIPGAPASKVVSFAMQRRNQQSKAPLLGLQHPELLVQLLLQLLTALSG